MITLMLSSDQGTLTLSEETFERFSDEIAKSINELIVKLRLPSAMSINIRPDEGLRIHLKGIYTDSVGELNWLIRHIDPIIQFDDIIFKMLPPTDTASGIITL